MEHTETNTDTVNTGSPEIQMGKSDESEPTKEGDILALNDCISKLSLDKNSVIEGPNGCKNHSVEEIKARKLSKSESDSATQEAEKSECECDNHNLESSLNKDLSSSQSDADSPQDAASCDALSQNQLDDKEEKLSCDKEITYEVYESELQMPDIMRLITKDLSEPYSIYTYRYFIHNWPKLCFLAKCGDACVGAIVCKLDLHKKMVRRGYIAMLAVDQNYRRKGIGSQLVLKAIRAMVADDCDEVVLETEISNKAALRLYENLGFVRDKRLFRYYLNGVDAFRLKLWLR